MKEELKKTKTFMINYGPSNLVGIAAGYGLDSPGSNPAGGDFFRTCPDRPWGPTNLLYNGYQVFPGGKERSGRDADPSPPSSAVGHERVELYLYSPMGRTACTEPPCKRVHFTFYLL
jgi:hypothetical protein